MRVNAFLMPSEDWKSLDCQKSSLCSPSSPASSKGSAGVCRAGMALSASASPAGRALPGQKGGHSRPPSCLQCPTLKPALWVRCFGDGRMVTAE